MGKKSIHSALLLVNLAAAMSLLMAYLSVYINPARLAFPAFFGLAFYYLLPLNLLFVLIWIARLRKEFLISLMVIILGINHMNNIFPVFNKQKKAEGEVQELFRLSTYNARLFNLYGESEEERVEEKMMDLLSSLETDILCLQEFYEPGGSVSRREEVLAALGSGFHCHSKLLPHRGQSSYGIATFSRYPITGRGDIYHPNSASLTIYTDFNIKGDTVRVYNNHLQSIRLGRMERKVFQNPGLGDDIASMKEIKRISSSLRQAFIGRAHQADALAAHIAECPYPVIVCGDFNDTPVSYAYRRILASLEDAFVRCGKGAGFTYKGNYPANRIDYILYQPSLIPSDFKIQRKRYSDHYPISCSFALFRKSER